MRILISIATTLFFHRVRCNFPTQLNMSASDRLRLGSLASLQCLQQIANDKRVRERLALLGDRVLSLHVSERLLQRDATASAGEVTMRKLCYEMAASHAAFLRSTADAAALFAAAMESGSEHSLSTHFEALVGLLYDTGAHLATLDPFVRWCEVHAPPHQRCQQYDCQKKLVRVRCVSPLKSNQITYTNLHSS
jgi:dsRNA-specific ribonuclease